MEHIKVNTAEKRRNGIACKGKLVMIPATDKVDDNYAIITDKGWVKPIIISETEPFDAGDIIAHNEYGLGKVISRKGTGQYWICEFKSKRKKSKSKSKTVIGIFKVLAFSDNFSPNQLNMIADGKLRDGDDVMVECKMPNIIKLDENNHIRFAPIRKAFTTPMLEFLREYLKNTPKEQFQKEWKEMTEEFNSKEPEWVEPKEKESWDDIKSELWQMLLQVDTTDVVWFEQQCDKVFNKYHSPIKKTI